MPSLLDLPAEIRILIFHNCLHVDHVISTYSNPLQKIEKRQKRLYDNSQLGLGLFSASRTIGREARHVFYSINTFKLSIWAETQDGNPDDELSFRFFPAMWRNNYRRIKRVVVDLSFNDLHSADHLFGQFIADGPPEKDRAVHDALTTSILVNWARKLYLIRQMDLQLLMIDFTQCRCAFQCCSLIDTAILHPALLDPLATKRPVAAVEEISYLEGRNTPVLENLKKYLPENIRHTVGHLEGSVEEIVLSIDHGPTGLQDSKDLKPVWQSIQALFGPHEEINDSVR